LAATVAAVRALADDAGLFTPASWLALEIALAAADAVLCATGTSQAQVNAALDTIMAAVSALVEVPPAGTPDPDPDPDPVVDTSVLTAVVAAANELSNAEGAYAESSWLALQMALRTAQAIAGAPGVTQVQVDAAAEFVVAAINSLVPTPPAPDPLPTPTVTVTTTTPGPTQTVTEPAPTVTVTTSMPAPTVTVRATEPASTVTVTAPAPTPSAQASATPSPTILGEAPPAAVVVTPVRVKLAQTAVTLVRGKSVTVPAAVYLSSGDAASAGAVTWKSSNAKIAKVSRAGKITAVKAGTATITAIAKAKAAGGKAISTAIKITVVRTKPAAKAVTVTANVPRALPIGQTAYVTGKYTPASATGLKVTYASSSPSVLAVDKAGRLVAKAAGKATVSVKAGKATTKYTVTVK
jgi:hypothetical protein